MVLEFYHTMLSFLKENGELVILCLAIVELLKLVIVNQEWYKKYMSIIIAAVISFAMAVPKSGFEVVPFLAGGIGLFLMATGVYKLLTEMMGKIAAGVEEVK